MLLLHKLNDWVFTCSFKFKKRKTAFKVRFFSLAYKTNAHTTQIKIFTTQGHGAHTAFVHRGLQNQHKMKVTCSCFKQIFPI